MSELAYIEDEQVTVEPSFTVTDDRKAEWCLKKIREAKAEKDFWKRYYDAQYKAIEEAADTTIANMEFLLQGYFESVPHKVTDTQENYKLPSGKLVLKRQEPEYDRNDEAVIEWLEENQKSEYVKVKKSLDWAGLKKTLTVVGDRLADSEGEIVPGINVVARPDVFKVEVK